MKQTENLSLNLFEGTDNFDYKIINENMEKLDASNGMIYSVNGGAILLDDAIPSTKLTVKVGGENANIENAQVKCCGKNIAFLKAAKIAVGETKAISGINITRNTDETYTVNGTATEDVDFTLGTISRIKNASYVLSGCPVGGSATTYNLYMSGVKLTDIGDGMRASVSNSGDGTANASYIQIRVMTGITVNNLVFKPQVEIGDVKTDFEAPIAPITGTVNSDGTVSGLSAFTPFTTIYNDKASYLQITCEYSRDIAKAITKIENTLNSLLGGDE